MNLDNSKCDSNVGEEKSILNSVLPPLDQTKDGAQKNMRSKKSKSKLKPPKPLGRMINLPPAVGYGNLFPSDSKVNSNYQEQRVTNNDRNNKSFNRLQQKKNNYSMRRDRNEQGSSNQDIQENDKTNDTWLWSQERKVQEDVIEMVTEKCSKLSYKLEALQQENDQLNRKLGTKESTIYNLKSEYQQQINEFQKKEKDFLYRIQSMELSIQSSVDDKAVLEADVSRLTEAFASESDKLSSVQQELSVARRNYETLLSESTRYKEEVDRCRNLRDSLIEKDDIIKKYEEQVEVLVDELENYKSENTEIVNTIQKNEVSSKHFETKIRTYQEQLKALRAENKELTYKLADQQSTSQKLADSYEGSNRELKEKMKQASVSSNNSIAHLKKNLREKESKINTITNDRDEQSKKVEMLSERVKRLTATVKDKNTIISNLQRLSEALESTNNNQKPLSQSSNKSSDTSSQRTPRSHRTSEQVNGNKKKTSPSLEKGSPNYGWNNNFHRKGNSTRNTSTKNSSNQNQKTSSDEFKKGKTEKKSLASVDRRTRRYTDPSQPPSISIMPESETSTPLQVNNASIEDPIAPFSLPSSKKSSDCGSLKGTVENQTAFYGIDHGTNNDSQNVIERACGMPPSTESTPSLRELRSKVSKSSMKNSSSLAASFDNDDDVPIWMR